jgi:hypothetical protein
MGAAARCIIQASRPEWELLTTRVCAQNCRERVVLTTPRCGGIGKQEEEAAAGDANRTERDMRGERGKKNGGARIWRGIWRASKNGG